MCNSATVDYPQYLMQENFIFNFSPKVQLRYYDNLKIEASNTHECTQNCECDLSSQAKSTE